MLERGGIASSELVRRLALVGPTDVCTTIVTYEEQMRGWLALAARATAPPHLIVAYQRLQTHIAVFRDIPVLPFDSNAANVLADLQAVGLRVGTMDLRIAAIALAHNGAVISRNTRDFAKVPGLLVEDWSSL